MAKAKQSPAHRSQKRVFQQTRVYVMGNFPFFWKSKFGISDHAEKRRRNVSETTPGYVFCLFSPSIPFGWELEQFVHRLYGFQNQAFWEGSGRTEWFLALNPIVGMAVFLGSHYFAYPLDPKAYALSFFCPFVWLDGLFWLLLAYLAREIAMVGTCLFIIYLIAHADFAG